MPHHPKSLLPGRGNNRGPHSNKAFFISSFLDPKQPPLGAASVTQWTMVEIFRGLWRRLDMLEIKLAEGILERQRLSAQLVAEIALYDAEANDILARRQIEESYNESGVTIRKRFLATFRRDIQKLPDYDREIVRKGNRIAHDGNAYLDALLFKLSDPPDARTYKELYGFTPDFVLEHCKWNIISTLRSLMFFRPPWGNNSRTYQLLRYVVSR